MSDTSVALYPDHRTKGATLYGKKRRHARRVRFDRDGVRRFLVAAHPIKTAENVAEKTGLPLRNVHRWLSDQASEPSLSNFIRLLAVYGAPFLAAALTDCPDWLDDHARLAKLAELERIVADAEAEREALLNGDDA